MNKKPWARPRLREEADADGALPRQGPNSMLSHCAGTRRVDVVQLILLLGPVKGHKVRSSSWRDGPPNEDRDWARLIAYSQLDGHDAEAEMLG